MNKGKKGTSPGGRQPEPKGKAASTLPGKRAAVSPVSQSAVPGAAGRPRQTPPAASAKRQPAFARWVELVAGLHLEQEIAPPAAIFSNSAQHYDRAVGELMGVGDVAVLPALFAKLADTRPVLRAAPPHFPLDAGYGKAFDVVTVADKVAFLLVALLGPREAKLAIANPQAWWAANGQKLRWNPKARRFGKTAGLKQT